MEPEMTDEEFHRVYGPTTALVPSEIAELFAGAPSRRQRPEIGLLFKARRRFTRDEEDLAAVVPTLSDADRGWLRDAIQLTEPSDNPWLAKL